MPTASDFVIRAATPAAAASIHGIWYAAEIVDEPAPPPPGDPQPWMRHILSHGSVLLAEDARGPVGFAGIIERGPFVFLTDLFVRPDRQSSGVGQALLARILPHDGRLIATVASSDPRAAPLYIRAGMRPEYGLFSLRADRERFHPEPQPVIVAVEALANDPDLLAWDTDLLGWARPEEHAYWVEQCAGTPLWLMREGTRVGYGYVRLEHDTPLWRPGMAVVGPLGVRDPAEAAACAMVAARWALERRPQVEIRLPGPHPALAPLLEAGARLHSVEQVLSTRPPCVDATRYLPSDSSLF